jgi:hypothetical protein
MLFSVLGKFAACYHGSVAFPISNFSLEFSWLAFLDRVVSLSISFMVMPHLSRGTVSRHVAFILAPRSV